MKTKAVTVGDTTVTIRELLLEDISELFAMDDDTSLIDRLTFMLGRCASIEAAEIKKHAPSDLQPLIDGFSEVNASFLAQADQVGMAPAAKALENIFQSLCMIAFAPSSLTDMAPESGNTPGPSSSQP